MRLIKAKQIEIVVSLLFFSIALAIAFACNRSFPDKAHELRENYNNDSGVSNRNKKILYLILDGAEGKEIKTLNPPNIRSLLSTSVYTWFGLSGSNPGDAALPAAWTSMVTGVGSDKNKVQTGFDTGNLSTYPTFITRIKNIRSSTRIAGYSSSGAFSENLLKGADINLLTENDDAQVKQNVIDNLENDSASIVIGQFHSIAIAGDQYGYSSTVSQYSDAVATVDGYIGEIIKALKNRPAYKSENWLVIVASSENGQINKNAGQDSTSVFNDSRVNSFVIFSSARFASSQQVNADGIPGTAGYVSFIDSVLELKGDGSGQVRVYGNDDKHIYDLVQGTQHTLELKVNIPASEYNEQNSGQGFYNLFGTLRNQGNQTTPGTGWQLMTCAGWCNDTRIFVNFVPPTFASEEGNSNSDPVKISSPVAGWHNLTLVTDWPASSDTIFYTVYLDGSPVTLSMNSGKGSAKRAFFLTRGYGGSPLASITSIPTSGKFYIGPPTDALSFMNVYQNNCYITDVRYWNVAFTDADVAKYSCKTTIPSDHPYLDKLAAYYKLNDITNTTVKDLSTGQQDAIIVDPSNQRTLTRFSETSPGICPDPTPEFYKASINGVDIPFQVFQWIGVAIQDSWGLDGKYWNTKYIDVTAP